MTNSRNFTNLPRAIAILTAGIFLFSATEAAFAKNGGNSNHSSGMSDHRDRNNDHGDKHTDKKKDKYKYAKKKKCEHPLPGTCGTNNIHPIVNKDPKSGGTTTAGNNPAPGIGGTNTIHPIINNPPAGGTAPSITLTGDSIKTSGSDSIHVLAGTTIVRDHHNGADLKVKVTSNPDGSATATATDGKIRALSAPSSMGLRA